MTPLQQAAERLIEQHGGLRSAALILNISPGYLSKIKDGHKEGVSDEILAKFGLRREINFTELNGVRVKVKRSARI